MKFAAAAKVGAVVEGGENELAGADGERAGQRPQANFDDVGRRVADASSAWPDARA